MLKGFKQFIMRGNVIDLAVGVIIGAAFGTVVNSLVKDVITPLIGALIKVPEFNNWYVTLHGSKIMFGSFINAALSFVISAAAIYFFIVAPINALMARLKRGEEKVPDTKTCPECLSEIPISAKKCKYCTTELQSS